MSAKGFIKSVAVLGAPKCSTSYLGKFFESSDNFEIVRHPSNRLECYDNIFEVDNLEYKFAKTPKWIFSKKEIDKLVDFYGNSNVESLFVVCVREYNYLLKSFYTMRLREWPSRYNNVCFTDWIDLPSLEYPEKSYGQLVVSLQDNIKYLIERLKDFKTIKFAILTDQIVSANSTLKIFSSLNVDIVHNNYKFTEHYHTTKCSEDVDNLYSSKFKELLNDKLIKKFIWKSE